MKAMLINHENLEKIDKLIQSKPDPTNYSLNNFLNHRRDWYLVDNYQYPDGTVVNWTILPHYILKDHYEFDAEKIRNSWTKIKRTS